MPNRLAGETSPYLLQHAGNPVDWYPWGEEALERARRENKLIFLSIGYAACHWCHVMEHESFEDESVAAILNQDYVSIKVDREERPDLDEIYMAATMLFSGGHGGWPMSVFLAPDQKPVFAGTYFPKHDAHGRPGFTTVLRFLQQKWQAEQATLVQDAGRVADALSQMLGERSGDGQFPGADTVERAAAAIYRAFDHSRGGIASGTNKFPQSMSLELLLRVYRAAGQAQYRDVVELTLERICLGGIYDHLGGGLHRYATDPGWLVPHFEKMLYDQALVASVLVDVWQASPDPVKKDLFASRACGICDYVLRDLRSPEGAFYSSEDADSEGQEGKFYIWTRDEIGSALPEADARLFGSHYDVSEHGNWMHPGDAHVPSGPKNVLQVVRSADVLARLDSVPIADVEASLARSRQLLFKLREQRVRPGLDDKVLTGWNGLMITALARVAAVLGQPRYGEAATRAADFALAHIRSGDRLLATYGKGHARLRAYSTDYAFLIEGLLALYEWNGEPRYLLEAESLTDILIDHYWDSAGDGFFLTAEDHEDLLLRSKTLQDGATPSSNSVMALSLQKLAILLGRTDYREKAGAILRLFVDSSLRAVFQQERLLSALDAWQQGWDEVAIIGPRHDERTRTLLAKARAEFRPNMVIVVSEGERIPGTERIPLLAGRGMIEGRPTAYVCRNYVCERPVVEPDELFAST
ncbi:MAG: thioredoxin domain-containing protein [Bryobacterales bacterium]|nr:thioredoxin domain-containing protein [Bryobacterales bacterium]